MTRRLNRSKQRKQRNPLCSLCFLLFVCILMLAGQAVRAAGDTNFTVNVNQTIPDANINGLRSSFALSGLDRAIGTISVSIDVSGGYNGDLYAYLTHASGFTVLLNRVGRTGANGFGYGDTGFMMTFADGAPDVHACRDFTPTFNGNGQLTGTWSPDGRNTDPASVTVASARTTDFGSQFVNTDPNGTWTIFFADMAGGGNPSTLVSWGISIVGGNTLGPPPTPGADALARHPSSGAKVRIATLLANDTSPQPGPLTLTSVSPTTPGNGTVQTSEGWVFYRPPAGFSGADSFTYVVADGGGLTATGTVSISISSDLAPSQNVGFVQPLGDGSFRIQFRGHLGRTYTIQYAESLLTPVWQTLGVSTADNLGKFEFIDTPPQGSPTRFYRSTYP